MEIKRLFDIIQNYKENFSYKDDALASKENGNWVKYSIFKYHENIDLVSSGLLSMGYQKGDKLITISNNRPEWNFLDHGMMQVGVIHIPVYPTLSIEDYQYIIDHSDSKAIFVSDKQLLQKVKMALANCNNKNISIFTFNKIENEKSWNEIVEIGKQNLENNIETIESIKNSISVNDIATIIYTSGTTGTPKGVMLSHNNIISNVMASHKIMPLDHTSRVLSFLPLCHVYERMMNYLYQYLGMSIYYAENMGTIADNLKEVKPHCFTTVPRLIERVYDKIISTGKDLTGFKKKIFFWALELGLQFELNHQNGMWYDIKLFVARKLVFKKWKLALGGNISIIVSGGAALQERLERVFWAAGIKVIEGYGLTETSPVIAVNDTKYPDIKFGTVGLVLEGTEIKIAEDGEILCKGPGVMAGYYKDENSTKEVIDNDGWFHTGDIGILVDNKFLKITDRKKEIFKSSSGKYIAPQIIENKLKESDFIEQAMVIGENEKFTSAIISPNFNYLHFWAAKHKVHYRENCHLIAQDSVISRVQREIEKINKTLAPHEQIKRFRMVCEEWSPQSGELSPTLKLKRKVLNQQYQNVIKEIYMHNES